jgi:nicotinate-nucleotide adenylyltransferase
MNIGLYFGSFNPIHTGHLIIANHILNETVLDKVWFVVSPQNPFKHSSTLLNEYHRFHLVQKAIEGDDRLRAMDIEFSLPKPSYTIHTLVYLKEKYPNHSFTIIMGSDSFQNLPKWKNAETIINNYPIIIYRRPGFEVETTGSTGITIMDAPLLEISATYIRNLIITGKSIKYLVPSLVEAEIKELGYYKNIKKNNLKEDKPKQ